MKNKNRYTLAALTFFAATAAQAVELKVSGQINRAVMIVDDGQDTETYFVDNPSSSTRFRFTAIGDLTEEVKAGALLEVEFESNPAHLVSKENPSIPGELQERHMQVFFRGGFGEVLLGQGNGAANSITHIDLSGTGVTVTLGQPNLLGGSTAFLDDGIAGPTVSQAVTNFDFESRYDRVAYETPQLGPLQFAVSAGRKNDMIYEAAARYTSDLAFGKVAAGVGYSTENVVGAADSNRTFGGSASVLLDSGLNAAITHSQLKADADYDAKQTMVRFGYRTGQHAASVDYALGEDIALAGDEGTAIGVNYVFSPTSWAELYATARNISLDREGSEFDDVKVVAVGSRVKF